MHAIFSNYHNLTALAFAVLLALIITFRLKQEAGKTLRSMPAYFLVFGPTGLLTFLFFLLLENSYNAVVNSLKGTFVYDYRFYSLELWGIAMAYFGFRLLFTCLEKCRQPNFKDGRYVLQLLPVFLLSVPLIPLTYLAYAPLFFCSISAASLPFVRTPGTAHEQKKAKMQARVIPLYPKPEAEVVGKLADDSLIF